MNDRNLAKSMENGALYPRLPAHYLREEEKYCGSSGAWFEEKEGV
jgi:hypothetical protein